MTNPHPSKTHKLLSTNVTTALLWSISTASTLVGCGESPLDATPDDPAHLSNAGGGGTSSKDPDSPGAGGRRADSPDDGRNRDMDTPRAPDGTDGSMGGSGGTPSGSGTGGTTSSGGVPGGGSAGTPSGGVGGTGDTAGSGGTGTGGTGTSGVGGSAAAGGVGGVGSGATGGAGGAAGSGSDTDRTGLLLTEYVEGSASNKVLEIGNRGALPVSLDGCELRVYTNGASEPSKRVPLAETLNPGDVVVLCHPRSTEEVLALCDIQSGSLNFNGDDTVGIWCDDQAVDVFGQVGFDPGTSWSSGEVATLDATLRRDCAFRVGRTSATEQFELSEWHSAPLDDFAGIGADECTL